MLEKILTMLENLKEKLRPSTPLSDGEVLWRKMQKIGCVECKRDPISFFKGPSSGIATNIFCGHCGQGFNISPVMQWAERIHKDERYIERKANAADQG